jgi:hypothetical protein
MAKAGTIYFLKPRDDGERPDAVFIASLWDTSNDPTGPRKVVSFKKKDQETGEWVAPVAILFEDGTKINIEGKTILYRPIERRESESKEDLPF